MCPKCAYVFCFFYLRFIEKDKIYNDYCEEPGRLELLVCLVLCVSFMYEFFD